MQISEKEKILKWIEEAGFKMINCDGDGLINIKNSGYNSTSFFQKEYFGFEGVTEYLIEKL